MSTLNLRIESLESFRERVLENARKMDLGEALPSESTISFNSLREFTQVLTPKRVAVLEQITVENVKPVTLIAKSLRRKRDAVLRDISKLKQFGFVSTAYDEKHEFVACPTATSFNLVCQVKTGATSTATKTL